MTCNETTNHNENQSDTTTASGADPPEVSDPDRDEDMDDDTLEQKGDELADNIENETSKEKEITNTER